MRFVLSNVLMVLCFFSFAQTPEEIELCTALQSNQFYNETEANSALDRILDASGLAKNFTLTPCDNIKNAAAISYKGVRYILYDKEFLKTITDYTNDWANLFILAHEVGHHLNGHSVDVTMIDIIETKTLEAKRKQELEADEFAAFILAQLGAPINALIEPIDLVGSNDNDTYSSHPNKSKRMQAIRMGYDRYTRKENSITSVSKENTIRNGEFAKWQLEDRTDDPFRTTTDYRAFIENTNYVEGYAISSLLDVYFTPERYRNGSTSTDLEIYLRTDSNLSKLLNEKITTLIKNKKYDEFFRKREGYSLDKIDVTINFSLAIDDFVIEFLRGDKTINYNFIDDTLLLSETWEYNDALYLGNFDSSQDFTASNSNRYQIDEYNRLINALKKGSVIRIKIDFYLIRKNLVEGLSDSSIISQGDEINEELFHYIWEEMEFSEFYFCPPNGVCASLRIEKADKPLPIILEFPLDLKILDAFRKLKTVSLYNFP